MYLQFTEHIRKRKAVAFFLSELPESQSQQLFADAQIHIWAVEGTFSLQNVSQLKSFSVSHWKLDVVLSVWFELFLALIVFIFQTTLKL